MRLFYLGALMVALVPACLLIQPLEGADPDKAAGGSVGTGGGATGGSKGGQSPSGECGLSVSEPCLDSCITGTCCSQVGACMADTECKAAYDCVVACPDDDACSEKCITDHAAAFKKISDMVTCLSGCGCNGAGGAPSCGDDVNPTASRVKACVYDFSCDPLQPTSTVSDCITFGPQLACINSAQSCDDVQACKGRQLADSGSCAEGQTGWKCDGDVAIRCDGSPPYSINCARLGAVCDPFESSVEPSRWPCRQTTPSSCSDSPADTKCYGDVLYNCIDGQVYGINCLKWGQVCVEIEGGKAYCSSHVSTCDVNTGVTCEQNSISVCDTDGRLGIYDCSVASTTCTTQGTSSGYCLSPGCTTEDADACQESCLDDTSMKVCVGGAPYTIDCTEYGFSECVEFINHPITGKNYVACR